MSRLRRKVISHCPSPSPPTPAFQVPTLHIHPAPTLVFINTNRSRISPKEIFKCDTCNKEFNRKDVYQRHLRAVHNPNQAQRRGWKKSCQRCIRYKLKCSREIPCASCSNKEVPCTYDASVARQISHKQTQPRADTSWDCASPENNTSVDFSNKSTSADYSFGASNSHPELNTPLSLAQPSAHPTQPDESCLYNSAPQPEANVILGNQPSHSPEWNFHNPPMALFDQSPRHSSIVEGEFPWLDGLSLDLEAFDSNMFRASRMDWLGCETDFSDQQTVPSLSLGEMQPVYDEGSANEDLMTRTVSTRPQDLPRHVGNEDQTAEAGDSEKDHSTAWPGVLDRGGNEMWPFDYASNKGYRKIKLPPLREILEQTVGSLPAIRTSTVKDLIKVLSAPLIPSLNESPALEALPAVAFLGQLVKTYFAEFHPALSIVHVPTWRIEKCPTALLAAMACIGATYSTTEGSQEIAALLAEITQRTLFWMVSK